jgi:hypothetical protein
MMGIYVVVLQRFAAEISLDRGARKGFVGRCVQFLRVASLKGKNDGLPSLVLAGHTTGRPHS